MKNGSTLRVGLDVHKESIAVAYAGEDGTEPGYVGEIGTRTDMGATSILGGGAAPVEGATLVNVMRLRQTLVPRARQAPDGYK